MNKISNSQIFESKLTSQQVMPRSTPAYKQNRVDARAQLKTRVLRQQRSILSRWIFFVALVALTFMFCAMLNLKMQTEVHQELNEQSVLRSEIEQLQNSNFAISKELNQLQNDSATIERAARQRLNMVRSNERVIVPARKF